MNAAPRIVRIVSAWPPGSSTGPDTEWILCPWLSGLPRRFNLLIASLPIHDANAVLLDTLASAEFQASFPKPAFAGVCLVDPFREMEKLFQALGNAGISGVVNLPTVGAFGGTMARALDDLGTGVDREIAMLMLARAQGLRIAGVATVPEVGVRMVGIGCDFVLFLEDRPGAARRVISRTAPDGHPTFAAAFSVEED
jgi:predicted TIM-barrel enzyme